MRLMVSAGATGGGIYPALAVLQALGDKPEAVLWVGSIGGMETDLVNRAGVSFKAIPAAGLHGRGLKAISGLWQLARGYFAARKLIAEFRPDVLFFTGGYVAVPTGMAGRHVPTLLLQPDIEPALALKSLARFADKIAVPVEDSRQYFREGAPIDVVGYPTRPGLEAWDREKAFEAFQLSPDKPTLLVTGGSLGARSINQALVGILPELLGELQVIHLTGKLTWPEVEAATKDLPADLATNYRPFPFLHDRMGAALSAADLVVSRAGASVLGELPAFELPGILVPYPHAWQYQKINADYLASRGAALVVRDEDLKNELLPLVKDLLFENPSRRMKMKAAVKALAVPNAAERIAGLLYELAKSANEPSQGGVQ